MFSFSIGGGGRMKGLVIKKRSPDLPTMMKALMKDFNNNSDDDEEEDMRARPSSFFFKQDSELFETLFMNMATKTALQRMKPSAKPKTSSNQSDAVEADLESNSVFRYNGKICFKLCTSCPDGKCGNKRFHWVHCDCKSVNYIDEEGCIFCEQSAEGKCPQKKYFIQNAEFKCTQDTHHSQYVKVTSSSDILMAIGHCIQSVKNVPDLDKKEQKQFANKIQENIHKNWVDEDD